MNIRHGYCNTTRCIPCNQWLASGEDVEDVDIKVETDTNINEAPVLDLSLARGQDGGTVVGGKDR